MEYTNGKSRFSGFCQKSEVRKINEIKTTKGFDIKAIEAFFDQQRKKIDWKARDAEIKAWEEKEKLQASIVRYQKNVPFRYWNESFDTFKATDEKQKEILQLAKDFSNRVSQKKFQTLVMLGNAGTGKTHLACSIIRRCGVGYYRLSSQLCNEMQSTRSFNAKETEREFLERYNETSLLVIDEIGRAQNSDFEKYMLYQVINERYNNFKSTILISNIQGGFSEYVGSATVDRLTESAIFLHFGWQSMRAKMRQK